MVTFHIDEESARRLDDAYRAHRIDSKDNVVALAAAVGIARDRKKELKNPVVFRQSFSEFDRHNMLALNAINKNLSLVSEEEVAAEVERYAEGGLELLLNEDMAGGKLDYFKVYRKYCG
ncbi:MAG: hypothetical protein FJ149_05315 [Euryarchaeota archaeon]|nr:hypothetical protein [Euryarchaeota archaeon]